jgi:hypothetical protein
MKRIVLLMVCLFISIISQAQNKEWTIMVYVAADNNLDPYAELDLKEMLKTKLDKNINLIVQVDKSEDKGWADWSTCRRMEIKSDLDYREKFIEDIGEINTGDPAELTRFIDWTVEKYPANKYGLIIWNHGDGWRLANLNEQKADPKTDPVYKAVASDDQAGDRLYMNEISSAIKNCKKNFEQEKFEFIGFDACLMGMIEVWYELDEFAMYGIGSEDLEPGLGWDYEGLVVSLNTTSNDSRKLCKSIVSSYESYYKKHPDSYTLSAIDLSKVSTFSTQLSSLTKDLLEQPKIIKQARKKIKLPYGHIEEEYWPNSIDLKKFLSDYRTISKKDITNKKIKSLLLYYDGMVIANVSDSANKSKNGSNGLAIYFPETEEIFLNDPDGSAYSKDNQNFPVKFVQKEMWSDFLSSYLKKKAK